MTYPDAVAWLDQFANLERRPDAAHWSGIKLERVQSLLAELGDPQRGLRVVHIAGSKGKGSVAAMIDAMLRSAGYHTGLYTSPHLVSPRERIRLDGEPIERETAARLITQRLKPAVEARQAAGETELSWFDLHTALAFCRFAEADVDWAVVEVGLGGRLDATNVVEPAVCAITAISLEHTMFLGHTLEAIAGEKAGIIKPGVPVVTAPQPAEAASRIAAAAAAAPAPLIDADGVESAGEALVDRPDGGLGQALRVRFEGVWLPVLLPLIGAHQRDNAAVALRCAELLRDRGAERLDAAAVVRGLETVHWPGRLEVIGRRPWLVLDGAHNPASAEALRHALGEIPHRRRYAVIGSARDKDLDGFLAGLGPVDGLIAAGVPDNPRSRRADELLPLFAGHAEQVAAADDVGGALAVAQQWAEPDDLIVVTGSLYLVGAALRIRHGDQPV